MRKLYRIKLLPEERSELESLGRKRTAAAHKVTKARALLLCDESDEGPGLKDWEVVRETGIKDRTLERLRERCCEVGPLEALERKEQDKPSRPRKLNGEQQAQLTKLACSEPPEGCGGWSLRLLAENLVELEIVDAISHETVRRELKKTKLNPG
jgi:transposase